MSRIFYDDHACLHAVHLIMSSSMKRCRNVGSDGRSDIESGMKIAQKRIKRLESEFDFDHAMRVAQKRKHVYLKRKREAEGRGYGLHELIAFEILKRLPIKSLLRCKEVCKSWYTLISDPSFVASHMRLSNISQKHNTLILVAFHGKPGGGKVIKLYSYNMHEEQLHEYKNNVAKLLFRIDVSECQKKLASPQECNGLLLVNMKSQVIICNPATKDYVSLPPGNRKIKPKSMAGFGFVSSISAFKVAQFFYRPHGLEDRNYSIGFEVFTLGNNSSWRVIEDAPYPIDTSFLPVSVGEFIYYKIDSRLQLSDPKPLLSLNLRKEKFTIVKIPKSLATNSNHDNMNITNVQGNPCLVYQSEDRKTFDLWININHDNDGDDEYEWIHLFSFGLVNPVRFVLPVAFNSGGKLLMKIADSEGHRLVYYNPQTNFFEHELNICKKLIYYDEQEVGVPFLSFFRHDGFGHFVGDQKILCS